MSQTNALDWQTHLHAGRQYMKTAKNGLKRANVFNNELIYQLTAMAIEKILVSLFQYHQQMPEDHTLDGLVDGLTPFCPLDSHLADSIKAMGRHDNMCPLVPVHRSVPTDMEIAAILAVGAQVAGFAETHIAGPGVSNPETAHPTMPVPGERASDASSVLN